MGEVAAVVDCCTSLLCACSDVLEGVPMILRYLARSGTTPEKVYGTDALASCQVGTMVAIPEQTAQHLASVCDPPPVPTHSSLGNTYAV